MAQDSDDDIVFIKEVVHFIGTIPVLVDLTKEDEGCVSITSIHQKQELESEIKQGGGVIRSSSNNKEKHLVRGTT